MSTLFEPSLSTTSTMRPPFSSTTTTAPSMADTLPNINFGFDDLRERMARFTDRFNEYTAEGRKRFLEERNRYRINLAELKENHHTHQTSLALLTQKQSLHTHTLSLHSAEKADLQTTIQTLSSQRTQHQTHLSTLSTQLQTLKSQIALRETAQATHASNLDSQSAQNDPELEFWESLLGLRIEGAGMVDRLRFVFWNLDGREWGREAWFELDMGRRAYEIVGVGPVGVGEGVVEGCLGRLNESRDLARFLREMREGFVGVMR